MYVHRGNGRLCLVTCFSGTTDEAGKLPRRENISREDLFCCLVLFYCFEEVMGKEKWGWKGGKGVQDV